MTEKSSYFVRVGDVRRYKTQGAKRDRVLIPLPGFDGEKACIVRQGFPEADMVTVTRGPDHKLVRRGEYKRSVLLRLPVPCEFVEVTYSDAGAELRPIGHIEEQVEEFA